METYKKNVGCLEAMWGKSGGQANDDGGGLGGGEKRVCRVKVMREGFRFRVLGDLRLAPVPKECLNHGLSIPHRCHAPRKKETLTQLQKNSLRFRRHGTGKFAKDTLHHSQVLQVVVRLKGGLSSEQF